VVPVVVHTLNLAKKRAKYEGASAEVFIRTWEESSSAQEVAEKLGMPVPIVHARASNYRRNGVKLKDFGKPRGRGRLNVDELNALIERIRSGDTEGAEEQADSSQKKRRKS
jgi:hypothetical protein